jgi:uncharacterized protein
MEAKAMSRRELGKGTEKLPLLRGFYAGLGFFFVVMGGIGVVVPVWPTTIFLILALWSFKKSSPRMEAWLLSNRYFGPSLRDWEETGSVRKRTKVIAIGAIWLSILVSCLLVSMLWVRLLLLTVAIALTLYLLSRPIKPE